MNGTLKDFFFLHLSFQCHCPRVFLMSLSVTSHTLGYLPLEKRKPVAFQKTQTRVLDSIHCLETLAAAWLCCHEWTGTQNAPLWVFTRAWLRPSGLVPDAEPGAFIIPSVCAFDRRESSRWLIHSPKGPHQPGLGQAEAGSQGHCAGLPYTGQKLKHLGHSLLISHRAQQEREEPGLEPAHRYGMWVFQAAAYPAVPQHRLLCGAFAQTKLRHGRVDQWLLG